jgi:hypothetical protein
MRANAIAALSRQYPKSVNRIFVTQDKPRLPRVEIAALMAELVATGYVEEIEIGFMKYYRWRDLALAPATDYNSGQRSESSLVEEPDWFVSTLYPLHRNVAVHLSLEDPRFGKIKHYRGKRKNQLVVLVPGVLVGLRQEYLLVAIVGSGSCLIRPHIPGHSIADLVLAGMPAKLATTLMNKLHLIFTQRN